MNALTEKFSLNSRSVEEVFEEVRQTVKALSHRLTCYRHKRSCRQQNSMFTSNQHKFYQQIGSQPVSLDPPPVEETLNFWSDLWSIPRHFNTNANWQDTLGQGYAPMCYSHFEKKDFNRALKRIANWKSP